MRCNRRAFGVKNLRGHDARWHANYKNVCVRAREQKQRGIGISKQRAGGTCMRADPQSSHPGLSATPQADRGIPFGAEINPSHPHQSLVNTQDDYHERRSDRDKEYTHEFE